MAAAPAVPTPVTPVSVQPQRRTGIVTVATADRSQASTVLVTVTRQDTGAVQDLVNEGPNQLSEGAYLVNAMFKDDSEAVFERKINVETGSSLKLTLPTITYSIAYQNKTLVAGEECAAPEL